MEFSIKSSRSDRALVFSNLEGDDVDLEIRGLSLSARTTAYLFTDAVFLSELFQKLGALDKPWEGEKRWDSFHGDCILAITCDRLGRVTFEVKLKLAEGEPEAACVFASLMADFGQLADIAREAQAFFAEKAAYHLKQAGETSKASG